MNRLLQLLSPNTRIWLSEHGWIVVVALMWLGGAIATVLYLRPDPVTERTYFKAKVLSSADTSTDSGFSVRFALEHPDGTPFSTSTSSLPLAMTVVDTACIEQRTLSSGKIRFALMPPDTCAQ